MTDNDELQAGISAAIKQACANMREFAEPWPESDTNRAQHQATLIESHIPPDSQHGSAIEARRYCTLAREAQTELKGEILIGYAKNHLKDFQLYDDAIKGVSHSEGQSKKAKLPRSIIPEIKENLVSKYPDYMAKELWPHLFAELQERGLDPEDNDSVPGKEWYSYDHKDGRKTIKFTTFANIKSR